jgi:hypothetical protein
MFGLLGSDMVLYFQSLQLRDGEGRRNTKIYRSDVSADIGDRKMDTSLMNGDDLITGSEFGVEDVRVTLRDSR